MKTNFTELLDKFQTYIHKIEKQKKELVRQNEKKVKEVESKFEKRLIKVMNAATVRGKEFDLTAEDGDKFENTKKMKVSSIKPPIDKFLY